MKDIYIYKNHTKKAPSIYLNVFEGDGADIWDECLKLNIPAVTMIVISGISWDEELSPWKIPPVFHNNNFQGKADIYISELISEIIPSVEKKLEEPPTWQALAGYSLGGLFAIYTAYKTNYFHGVISISGSLWFPNFIEYMNENEISNTLKYAYFSLGNKEHKTRNPLMSTVLEKTKEAESILKNKGIITTFQENQGNHFKDQAKRIALGIYWILSNQ